MKKLNSEIAELIGIIIGDGFIHNKNGYYFGFTGNPETDKYYYDYIKKLIFSISGKNVKVRIRSNGIRIVVYSKHLVNFFTKDIGLFHGIGKSEHVEIPNIFYKNWNLAKHTLRGIADTDGSIFVANKKGCPNYPSIEITTNSYSLALQIQSLLMKRGFRVAKIWHYKSKLSKNITYKVPLNGTKNVEKWINEIGFSNPYKMKRAISILNKK